ncbi:ABC transporter permease [Mycolicibacterium psychrotolerans]|uniref:ABC transporter permease n=1 Tax=Mycolicibacterium psychrotolerans TaxID=216929 RepID=UPI003D6660CA
MTAVAVLTERILREGLHGDLPFAVLAPAGNFVIFNLALRNVIDTGGISYAQYLLPVILIQVTLLGALTTVDRAAREHQSELGVRLRTLPLSALTPLTARMTYCLFRAGIALLATIGIGYVFGFRMIGGAGYQAAFVALVLIFTLALSLVSDAIGVWLSGASIAKEGGTSQVLLVPQLLLVMLSTGMAPVESFPHWLHGFVQYQPVSLITATLRQLASGEIAVGDIVSSLAWCIGLLLVCVALAVRMQRRTQ